jgi:hypothetical protein
MEKVHINNGSNKPICGAEDLRLTGVKECTSCLECQKLRAEAMRKLRTLRRLEADRKIVHDYLYGPNSKNLSDEDLESYKIRLEEIEIESRKNHPQSNNEAYLMSELSVPITAEVEHV